MIRELWRWLVAVFFRSQPAHPPPQPEEKPVPVNIGEGVLSPPPGEEVEVEIPAMIQENHPLSSADENKEAGISTPILVTDALHPKEHPNWEIRPCKPREFDKVGRLFMEGGDLVIKVDGLPFYVILASDLKRLMDGEIVDLRETGGCSIVGTARLSASRRGVNFRIGERLYTVPLRNFQTVVLGKARKAAVFEGNGGDS